MCEGDGNARVGSGGAVVAVSACMSGTRVGRVCDMCMCLARAVWVERGVSG